MRCSLIFLEAVRVADPRRLYLKLQAELGGAEVYLARPGEVRLPAAGTVGAGTGVPPAEATGDEVTDQSDATAGGRPARAKTDWRRNLPAIPGPGLEIVAPEAGLLDPLPLYPSLADLATAVRECQRCFLCQGRTNTVPGEGDPQAGLMCVGEGPGETEDRTGRPFVGRAGELLNGILAAIELSAAGRNAGLPAVPSPTDPAHPAQGAPGPRGDRRRGASRGPEEPWRIARASASFRWNTAGGDLPSRRAVEEPELEEADLG
jgi:hypothetical protein